MPDEAPEQVQDTPTPEDEQAPSQDTPVTDSQDTSDDVDWSKRYNDLRPEFDRTKTQLSQYEEFIQHLQDPETQSEALAALGFDLEGDEDEDDFEYDEQDPLSEIEQIKEYLVAQEEESAMAEAEELEAQYLDQSIKELEKSENVNLSDEERETLELLSHQLRDDDDIPDVQAAFKALSSASEASRKRYLETKRSPRAPSGASPSHEPNLDDTETRREWLAQQLLDSAA